MLSLKHCIQFLCFICFSTMSAEILKDRLVAIVEKKPITELEIFERYKIHASTNTSYNHDYEMTRPALIQELCLEKMNDLLWERLTNSNIELSGEQLQAFKKNYHLEALTDSTVHSFYAGLVKKERLARHLIQDNIQLSDYELNYFMHQPQAWQQIGALWSFKILYKETPITDEGDLHQAKEFKEYPAGKINKATHEHIDWKKIGSWQFFQQDGEYVAVFIDSIQLPTLLATSYTINLLSINSAQEPNKETLLALFSGDQPLLKDDSLNKLTIHTSNDLPANMIAALPHLAPQEVTEPVMVGGRWYAAQLISQEPLSKHHLEDQVTALFKQQLLDKKTEEKLPMWYDSLKKDYFIKVLA